MDFDTKLERTPVVSKAEVRLNKYGSILEEAEEWRFYLTDEAGWGCTSSSFFLLEEV